MTKPGRDVLSLPRSAAAPEAPADAAPAAPLLLVAAVALVDADGRILLTRRPAEKEYGGLWEFPGGKVEDGESPERAALRELWEELRVEPCRTCLDPFAFASQQQGGRHILMPLFICRQWDGVPAPQEGQDLAWAWPKELLRYDMPPVDVPLAAELEARFVR